MNISQTSSTPLFSLSKNLAQESLANPTQIEDKNRLGLLMKQAIQENEYAMALQLFEKGADITARDSDGFTPFDCLTPTMEAFGFARKFLEKNPTALKTIEETKGLQFPIFLCKLLEHTCQRALFDQTEYSLLISYLEYHTLPLPNLLPNAIHNLYKYIKTRQLEEANRTYGRLAMLRLLEIYLPWSESIKNLSGWNAFQSTFSDLIQLAERYNLAAAAYGLCALKKELIQEVQSPAFKQAIFNEALTHGERHQSLIALKFVQEGIPFDHISNDKWLGELMKQAIQNGEYTIAFKAFKQGADTTSLSNQQISQLIQHLNRDELLLLLQRAENKKNLCEKLQGNNIPDGFKIAEQYHLKYVAYSLLENDDDRQEDNDLNLRFTNDFFKQAVFETAVSANHVACLVWIANGFPIDKITDDKLLTKLFIIACKYNDIDLANILLKFNFNINIDLQKPSPEDGMFSTAPDRTPLMAAVHLWEPTPSGNALKIIKILIEQKKVSINAIDLDRSTALMYACNDEDDDGDEKNNQREEHALYLLASGANRGLQNKHGMTALMLARQSGYNTVVKKLMSDPTIDIMTRDNYGCTAFGYFGPDEKSVQLIKEIFSENCVIISAIDTHGSKWHEILRANPEQLYNNKSHANPLFLPLLVDRQFYSLLGQKIARLMSKEELNASRIDLEKRLPASKEAIKEFFITIQYSVNPTHYSKIIDTSIPDIPNEPTEKPKLSPWLLELFMTINFTDDRADFYVDPRTVFNDTGDRIEVTKALKERFEKFLKRIRDHEEFLGTPAATVGYPPVRNSALDAFWNPIEAALYHIVQAIQNRQNPQQKRILTKRLIFNILRMSPFCAGRVYTDCMQICKRTISGKKISFETIVTDQLMDLRHITFERIIPHTQQSVHVYISYIRAFGEKIGLSGVKNLKKFHDKFRYQASNEELTKAYKYFLYFYNSALIVNWIFEKFKYSQSFKNSFINWLKKNVPNNFQPDTYAAIRAEFLETFPTLGINSPISGNKEVRAFLNKKNISVTKKTLTPEAAIQGLRSYEYMESIMSQGELGVQEAIIDALLQQKVIQIPL